MTLLSLFSKPNVEKLKAKNDIKGLIQAAYYKKDANIRTAAATALGEIGDVETIKAFFLDLHRPDATTEIHTAIAMIMSRLDRSSTDDLIASLEAAPFANSIMDLGSFIKIGAIRADGMVNLTRSVTALWEKDNRSFRSFFLKILTDKLAQYDDDDATNILVLLHNKIDKLTSDKREALTHLNHIRMLLFEKHLTPGAIESLLGDLWNKDSKVREFAAQLLGRSSDAVNNPNIDDQRRATIAIYSRNWEALRKLGVGAIKGLNVEPSPMKEYWDEVFPVISQYGDATTGKQLLSVLEFRLKNGVVSKVGVRQLNEMATALLQIMQRNINDVSIEVLESASQLENIYTLTYQVQESYEDKEADDPWVIRQRTLEVRETVDCTQIKELALQVLSKKRGKT